MIETMHTKRHLSEIRRVRKWVAMTLEHQAAANNEKADWVVLLVSELVTNVLEHTDSCAEVTLQTSIDQLLIEVGDDDPTAPVMRTVATDEVAEPSGRGLRLLARLVDEWGVRPRIPMGKTVWFRMDLAS